MPLQFMVNKPTKAPDIGSGSASLHA
jgi:hypothetical protein